MQEDLKKVALAKVEDILRQKIPIELKVHRIFIDVLMPLIASVRSEYENLMFMSKENDKEFH